MSSVVSIDAERRMRAAGSYAPRECRDALVQEVVRSRNSLSKVELDAGAGIAASALRAGSRAHTYICSGLGSNRLACLHGKVRERAELVAMRRVVGFRDHRGLAGKRVAERASCRAFPSGNVKPASSRALCSAPRVVASRMPIQEPARSLRVVVGVRKNPERLELRRADGLDKERCGGQNPRPR